MFTWQLTTSKARADGSGTGTGTATETGESLWEYTLKCISDPSDKTPPGFSLTDLGSVYEFGYFDSNTGINPNGFGDDATLKLGIGGNGPSEGDVALSMTVSVKVVVEWVNEWTNIFGGQHDESEGPAEASADCTMTLVSRFSPKVIVTPDPQVPIPDNRGDLSAQALVNPSFLAQGAGAYFDDGRGSASVAVGPFTFNGKSSAKTYTVGPRILDWAVVVMRRKRGSTDPWQPNP
jgi:hypothetical protein